MKKYRVLCWSRVHIDIGHPAPRDIDGTARFAVRRLYDDPVEQTNHGGLMIGVEFLEKGADLMVALSEGVRLAESVAAGLALASDVGLPSTEPIQVVEAEENLAARRFLFLRPVPVRRFPGAIDAAQLNQVAHIVRHMHGLPDADRIMSSALRYQEALSADSWLDAFTAAWLGLEFIEPVLAHEANLKPGSEEVDGKCVKCGYRYKYWRSMLVGVRSFFIQRSGPDEWKRVNGFRAQVIHATSPLPELKRGAVDPTLAALHLLHDALVHICHCHELESTEFVLNRLEPKYYGFLGDVEAALPPLGDWGPFLEPIGDMQWVRHADDRIVPEAHVTNTSGGAIQGTAIRLPALWRDATEDDLIAVPFESLALARDN